MKGLELSKLYYQAHGRPMIEQHFPQYAARIAVGLVGMGSECFGFDDEISQDHDWGPGFCLWLNKQDYEVIGAALKARIVELPQSFEVFDGRQESSWGKGRTGVFEIGSFYKQFMGFEHVPTEFRQWRMIPESNLATATNGEVFTDPLGEFTAFRTALLNFYPEDIRLKKIAHRCMLMAQSGQYNFMRCAKRGELVAAQCSETEFLNTAVSMVFLLNKKYRPFYKWMHRGLQGLPILGAEMYQLCADLVTAHTKATGEAVYTRKQELIESICSKVIAELRRQNLSDSTHDFLLEHGPQVQKRIQDPQLKSLNVWTQ